MIVADISVADNAIEHLAGRITAGAITSVHRTRVAMKTNY